MRIVGLKTFVVGNPPPTMGGRYFLFLKLVTDDNIEGVGEIYAASFAPEDIVKMLEQAGLKVQRVMKLLEGRPNVIDLLKNKEIQLVINTPSGATPRADEVKIRTTAVYTGTPIMTTLSGAKAAALGIAALKKSGYAVKTVQEYH